MCHGNKGVKEAVSDSRGKPVIAPYFDKVPEADKVPVANAFGKIPVGKIYNKGKDNGDEGKGKHTDHIGHNKSIPCKIDAELF